MESEVEDWVTWLARVRHVRGATLDAYSRTMFAFTEFVDADQWGQVTAPMIEDFMTRPRRGGDIGSAATQDRDRIAVGGFFKYLVSRGVVVANPVVDVGVPKVSNRMPRAISDDVWIQLWSSEMPEDDRAWLGLGCFGGLRRREIVSLSPTQVDCERGLILFLQRKGGDEDVVEFKQGAAVIADRFPQLLPDLDGYMALLGRCVARRASERCLVLHDTPASEIGRLRASWTDSRLPEPGALNRQLVRLLKAAGLPGNTFSPHALRHTCATNLVRAGVPLDVVSDYMGHADVKTTMRYVRTAGRLLEWRMSH